MIADDQRYTLRQAADLTGKSVDTLRRLVKDGKLPGAGQPQLIEDAQPDPLLPAPPHGGGRARRVGDPLVSGAEDQRGDELVEHHGVVDARSVTAQRVVIATRRQ